MLVLFPSQGADFWLIQKEAEQTAGDPLFCHHQVHQEAPNAETRLANVLYTLELSSN